MLNDMQKKLIEAEESFRHEVKAKLVEQAQGLGQRITSVEHAMEVGEKKFSDKIIEFLNSSLGTWFLSTVIVTGGAGLYQQVQHHYETQKQNHQEVVKYKYEIENRLDHLALGLRHAKTVGQAKVALQRLYNGKFPLTPELQNRALGSMYLNLYQLLSGSDVERAQQAISLIHELEDAELLLDNQPDTQVISDADKAKLSKIVDDIKKLHFKK
jgi:hypothetical protein